MTLYDFMILTNEQQLAHVMFCGSLITKLNTKKRHYHLYSVSKFFFEMEYDVYLTSFGKEAVLLRKHVFSSGVRMEKYIHLDLAV